MSLYDVQLFEKHPHPETINKNAQACDFTRRERATCRVHYQYKAKLAKPILSNHLVRHPSGAVRKRTLTRPSLFPKSLGGPLVDEAEKAGVSINYEHLVDINLKACATISVQRQKLYERSIRSLGRRGWIQVACAVALVRSQYWRLFCSPTEGRLDGVSIAVLPSSPFTELPRDSPCLNDKSTTLFVWPFLRWRFALCHCLS
jgi:hypothetical protein